jgi:hypothetical protein
MRDAIIIALLLLGGATSASAESAKTWERVRVVGKMQMIWISKDSNGDRQVYNDAISRLCPTNTWCGLLFWSDRAKIPTGLPMSDDQADSEVAAYLYNPQSKLREFMWNCRIHPSPNPSECMAE